jgi:hypothetical protein
MATSPDDDSATLTIPSSDIIRLIGSHLLEAGLHETFRTLQAESGVGLAGSLSTINFTALATAGNWTPILNHLQTIDNLPPDLLAETYYMSILEIADAGDLNVAYTAYRLVQPKLEESLVEEEEEEQGGGMTRARLLEQKLMYSARLLRKGGMIPNTLSHCGAGLSFATTMKVATTTFSLSLQFPHVRIGNPAIQIEC